MKYEIVEPKTIDITTVRLSVHVDDDDMPKDFPFRKGSMWQIEINIDTGVIKDWTQGVSADLCIKAVDSGSYWLLDDKGKVVASREQDYVPNGLIPGSYGDYIELNIEANGKIANWKERPDLDQFFEDLD